MQTEQAKFSGAILYYKEFIVGIHILLFHFLIYRTDQNVVEFVNDAILAVSYHHRAMYHLVLREGVIGRKKRYAIV